MSNLIQNQEDQHVLHKLNYHKIRDGLFNVTKWHDNGFSAYLFKSNDIKENNKIVGKQLELHIDGTLKYTVTYIYNKNPEEPTILIMRSNVYGNVRLNDLANPDDPDKSNKMYDIMYHIEKTIKRDIQGLVAKQKAEV